MHAWCKLDAKGDAVDLEHMAVAIFTPETKLSGSENARDSWWLAGLLLGQEGLTAPIALPTYSPGDKIRLQGRLLLIIRRENGELA
jgi:hypothetical protein